jgi:hypothetical protein
MHIYAYADYMQGPQFGAPNFIQSSPKFIFMQFLWIFMQIRQPWKLDAVYAVGILLMENVYKIANEHDQCSARKFSNSAGRRWNSMYYRAAGAGKQESGA